MQVRGVNSGAARRAAREKRLEAARRRDIDVVLVASEDACEHDMLVQIRWQRRKMAVPLSQLKAMDADESTQEAIGDWHYWVAQGSIL